MSSYTTIYVYCQVCVLDFPRRLTVEMDQQELLSQEFHRVAARMSMCRQICVLFVQVDV